MAAAKLSDMTVDELDKGIGERGDKIAALRKEQAPFLKAKDKLVQKETERIRASGSDATQGVNDNG